MYVKFMAADVYVVQCFCAPIPDEAVIGKANDRWTTADDDGAYLLLPVLINSRPIALPAERKSSLFRSFGGKQQQTVARCGLVQHVSGARIYMSTKSVDERCEGSSKRIVRPSVGDPASVSDDATLQKCVGRDRVGGRWQRQRQHTSPRHGQRNYRRSVPLTRRC
jgi:hypothetical protein